MQKDLFFFLVLFLDNSVMKSCLWMNIAWEAWLSGFEPFSITYILSNFEKVTHIFGFTVSSFISWIIMVHIFMCWLWGLNTVIYIKHSALLYAVLEYSRISLLKVSRDEIFSNTEIHGRTLKWKKTNLPYFCNVFFPLASNLCRCKVTFITNLHLPPIPISPS